MYAYRRDLFGSKFQGLFLTIKNLDHVLTNTDLLGGFVLSLKKGFVIYPQSPRQTFVGPWCFLNPTVVVKNKMV